MNYVSPGKKGFQKGNPGRPKGAKDKKTQQWDKFSEWFMSDGMERLEQEMAALEGKDYVSTCKDMVEYFKPKLARTQNETEVKGEVNFKWDKQS
jgi:hypothetical protein